LGRYALLNGTIKPVERLCFSEQKLKELSEMDQVIRNAAAKLEYLSFDTETIALYRAREDALHERANMISSAKAEGRKEGREEGREEGKFQGKLDTAGNLLLMGMDVSDIAKATGLDLAQIKDLKKNSQH
jgi:predicted transposase/invertase (TIGR01784 family)